MYRPTETHIYVQFVQSHTLLNNTTPSVPFPQNQQPVKMHSMNPLLLTPNHQTRFLMQMKSKDEFSTKYK